MYASSFGNENQPEADNSWLPGPGVAASCSIMFCQQQYEGDDAASRMQPLLNYFPILTICLHSSRYLFSSFSSSSFEELTSDTTILLLSCLSPLSWVQPSCCLDGDEKAPCLTLQLPLKV